jgi:hypothetical protein
MRIKISFFSTVSRPTMALNQRPLVPERFNSGHRDQGMNLITNLQLMLTWGMRGMQLYSPRAPYWSDIQTQSLIPLRVPYPFIHSNIHISLTLVHLPLDAQNYFLFTYNTFIKLLFMFRALPCSSSGGLRRNYIYAASGIVTLCRWLSFAPVKKEFFLNRCTRFLS